MSDLVKDSKVQEGVLVKGWSPDELKAAHAHCRIHYDEILKSEVVGCFYCLRNSSPSEIYEWTDWKKTGDELRGDGWKHRAGKGRTAICPRCGIDSVIGSASGYPVTDKAFLEAMNSHWFTRSKLRRIEQGRLISEEDDDET